MVAVGFNTLYYDAERRGIEPSARINEIADKIKKSTSYVYEKLSKTECIKNYLVPFYDVLHTMSSEKVCDEVFCYIEKRGEIL